MIRVLFIVSSSIRGGAQISLLRLISNLDRDRFWPIIYCPKGFLADEAHRLGLSCYVGGFGILGMVRLARLIRLNRFDIVNTALLGAALAGVVSTVLSRTSAMLVVTVNNAILYPGIGRWRRLLVVLTYRFINLFHPIYFTKSNLVKEELLCLVNVSSLRIHSIANPLPFESMPPMEDRVRIRTEMNIEKGEIAIGVVANLVPQKGHHYLIEAGPEITAHNPNVHFYFVGDGPMRSTLEKLASRVCPEHFRFLGERADSTRCILAMDIIVVPSFFEGFSNVLLEALALGRTVVATAVGGAEEIIQNGKNGVLVPVGDKRSLTQNICWLLDHPDIAAQMGIHGRETVCQNFNANKVAAEVGALLEQFVRKTQSGLQCGPKERVVLILISSSDIGGAQTHVAWLSQNDEGRAIRIVVACPPGPLLSRLVSGGSEVYGLRFGFLTCVRIASMIRATHAKILHVHLLGAALHGTIGSLLAGSSVVVYTVHNLVVYPGMKRWKRLMYPLVTRVLACKMEQIIAVSKEIGEFLVHSIKIPQHKVRLIHNGVSFSKEEESGLTPGDFRQRVGIPKQGQLLGTVGRITFQKGIDSLIEAFRSLACEFPALHCVIVGDGDQRSEIERLISEYRIQDRVYLPGFQQDVLSWYRAMDVVAFPSRFEGLPITVIEAAYVGGSIVATDVGGVKEILQDGVTGLLVPPEDTVALARGIRKLLNNPSFAAKLGRKARAIAIDRFDVRRCSAQTISVYKAIFEKGYVGRETF